MYFWGDHIASSDRTWPAQLERLLRARWDGAVVEVINLGQRGYTTVNEVEALDRLGWQADPDGRANQAAFRELADTARARGVPVVVMIWPIVAYLVWTADTHPLREIHENVARAARDAGLHVFDLTSVFGAAGGDGSRWWATPYDRHPNASADSLMVHALADYLAREHLGFASPPSSHAAR